MQVLTALKTGGEWAGPLAHGIDRRDLAALVVGATQGPSRDPSSPKEGRSRVRTVASGQTAGATEDGPAQANQAGRGCGST